jgi:hypothetical protein
MTMRMTRQAFDALVAWDIEWLRKQPASSERDNIEAMLRNSGEWLYPAPAGMPSPPLAHGWCVFIMRDGGQLPSTFAAFQHEHDAIRSFSSWSAQWTESYLCKVVDGPRTPGAGGNDCAKIDVSEHDFYMPPVYGPPAKAKPDTYQGMLEGDRVALVALATGFDLKAAEAKGIADRLREQQFPDWVEPDVIATTWQQAADAAWALLGGRPAEYGVARPSEPQPVNVLGPVGKFVGDGHNRLEALRSRRPPTPEEHASQANSGLTFEQCMADDPHLETLLKMRAGPMPPARSACQDRIMLGISFERVLPNGERERVDPSTIRIVVEGEPEPRTVVAVGFTGDDR